MKERIQAVRTEIIEPNLTDEMLTRIIERFTML
jgi:hypothetical protein